MSISLEQRAWATVATAQNEEDTSRSTAASKGGWKSTHTVSVGGPEHASPPPRAPQSLQMRRHAGDANTGVADLGGALDGGGCDLDFEEVAGSALMPSWRAASAA